MKEEINKRRDLLSQAEILKNSLLTDIQNNLAGERKKNYVRRMRLPFDYSKFCELLATEGTLLLERQHQAKQFIIDGGNEPVIRQLYLYSALSNDFCGDLHRVSCYKVK